MSGRYAFVQSGGSVLTVAHPITAAPSFQQAVNSEIAQTPFSTQASVVGDGQIKIEPFTVEWLVTMSTKGAAEAEIASIVAAARTATSLKYVLDGVDSSFRALVGVQNVDPQSINNQAHKWRLRVTFQPRFGQWTATRAETKVAFDAATKRWF